MPCRGEPARAPDAPGAARAPLAQREQQLAEQSAALQARTHAVSHDLRYAAPPHHLLRPAGARVATTTDAATRQEALDSPPWTNPPAAWADGLTAAATGIALRARRLHAAGRGPAPCARRALAPGCAGLEPAVAGAQCPGPRCIMTPNLCGPWLDRWQSSSARARSPRRSSRHRPRCGADGPTPCACRTTNVGLTLKPARRRLFGIFQRLHQRERVRRRGLRPGGGARHRPAPRRHRERAQAAPGAAARSVCAGLLECYKPNIALI